MVSKPSTPRALAALCDGSSQLPSFKPKQTITNLCLMPGPATADLTGGESALSDVWAFNGVVPGPGLRIRQGSRARFELLNRLPVPTTIHWHGIRADNAMDGVPGLTQAAVEPGEKFVYTIPFNDAGTYWYHPHLGTPEQVGRGLAGPLIVEETEPPAVDRELVWLLDDWRLDRNGQIRDDFYQTHDVAHGGRIGNTVTINGVLEQSVTVKAGERIRLRLINAANARIFTLQFEHHQPWLMALDGQAVAPEQFGKDQLLFLAPGQRADLILDCTQPTVRTWRIIDRFQKRRAYELTAITYANSGGAAPIAYPRRGAPRAIAANDHKTPNLADAMRVAVVLGGGAGPNRHAMPKESVRARAARRLRQASGKREPAPVWSVNGNAHMVHGKSHPFEFVAQRGQTVEITFENRTNWWHPMHVHGHAFQELKRQGKPVAVPRWRDTSLIPPRHSLTVAFVADNPGDWLIHCHVLEHHAGGMGTQFRVTS